MEEIESIFFLNFEDTQSILNLKNNNNNNNSNIDKKTKNNMVVEDYYEDEEENKNKFKLKKNELKYHILITGGQKGIIKFFRIAIEVFFLILF
jgi:uncharacterized membrane protein